MKKSVVTIGKFNGFHLGHQELLKRVTQVAREKDYSAICCKLLMKDSGLLTKDESLKLIEITFPEVEGIRTYEFTPEFAALTPEEFVSNILIDEFNAGYIVVGEDFHFGRDRAGDTEVLKKLGEAKGFEVEVIKKLSMDGANVSSSRIKGLLDVGQVEAADRLLGYSYSLSGVVESGKKLGRTFGYPTINLKVEDTKYLPRFGVYAVKVYISGDNRIYNGITNIGTRPSIEDGNMVTIETFIYDFSDDIYGAEVIVQPLHFIRGEKRFDSIDDLTKQIEMDILEARELTN